MSISVLHNHFFAYFATLMKTAFKPPRLPFSANYRQNALLHLIFATAVCYILLHGLAIIFMVVYPENTKTVMSNIVLPQVGLKDWDSVIHKPWTLLTYFLGHISFWNLISNMLWLYCFGSIIQNLIGYKEIILLYLSGAVLSAVVYAILSFVLPHWSSPSYILNAQSGVMTVAVAALTLSPHYRYYLGERLAIPILVVFVIYLLLNVMAGMQGSTAVIILLSAAAGIGFGYMRMLQNGSRPGRWLYGKMGKMESVFTPNEENIRRNKSGRRSKTFQSIRKSQQYSQDYIDTLLEKIHNKGYNSLTQEEKNALFKASREEK